MAQKRDETAPLLVKVFYRINEFHRLEEFAHPANLPPYRAISTWRDCTLKELTELIADAIPSVFPELAIGTRLVFRSIYRETRGQQKIATNDIGTVVIGEGRPGANPGAPPNPDQLKTLAEARFISGDYIACTILPPNEYTGEVAPASAAREGRGPGFAGGGLPPSLPPRVPTRPRGNGPFWGRGGGRGSGHRELGYSRDGVRGHVANDSTQGRRGPGFPDGDWPKGQAYSGR
ncbi:Sin3 associated polypeptide p18-domain-containing protein [Cladorrhinum sp. PSN332]|nr:Sin3 associated polypeptide p18-domain-containing protein [Cladorrhinum sp. PSN332]